MFSAVAVAAAAAAAAFERARGALRASDELTAGADCPLCGQELGDGFETVRKHRRIDAEAADAAVESTARAPRREWIA